MGLGFHDSTEDDSDNYTGAYSYDSPELRSYNPDHDIELIFDAGINNEDIKLISNIRQEINKAFVKDARRGNMSITVEHVMIDVQDYIKTYLDELLNKKRYPKSKEPSKTEYKWGQLKNQIDSKAMKELINDNENIFKYIDSVHLNLNKEKYYDQIEEKLEKLKKLELFAKTDWCTGEIFECSVCPNYLNFHEPKAASDHIRNNEVHREKARKIREENLEKEKKKKVGNR